MAAQAKPSQSFDSLLTTSGGSGSFFAPQAGSYGAAAASGGGAEPAAATAAYAASVAGSLPLGLYVHVPFCSSTCDFCAFYQEKPKRQSIDLYLEAVAAELQQVRTELERGTPWLWQGELAFPPLASTSVSSTTAQTCASPTAPSASATVAGAAGITVGSAGGSSIVATTAAAAAGATVGNIAVGDAVAGGTLLAVPEQGKLPKLTFTVFFGGGTPGLLPPEDLGRLCGMVRETLEAFGEIVEWSIELAPATVRPDRVKVLLENGVTRFSLGVQSFSDELLDGLGRQHSRKQIFAAFETLRAGGAKNINCDLMFALPGQTPEAWLTDLQTLVDLSPEHISTYCLTFEEDTAMWVKLSQGRYKLDPEREADLYRETWAWLANAGYAQYEVSNFAKEGYRSRHNLGTWSMGRWRGVGPSAASQWGGWRFQNPANLEGWAGAVLATQRRSAEAASGQPADCGCSTTTLAAASSCCSTAASPEPSLSVTPSAAPPTEPCLPVLPPAEHPAEPCLSGNVPATFPLGVKLPQLQWPPVQTEERVALTNRLLAADALIFGLRRRDGVNRAEWFPRFVGAQKAGTEHSVGASPNGGAGVDSLASALPIAEMEALFGRFNKEGLLDVAALNGGTWRLNDEGLLLADAVGGQLLECFETE